MEKRYVIVAGDFRQAEFWRHEHELPRSRVRYVSDWTKVRAIRPADDLEVVLYGTYYERRDWDEIRRTLRIQGLLPDHYRAR